MSQTVSPTFEVAVVAAAVRRQIEDGATPSEAMALEAPALRLYDLRGLELSHPLRQLAHTGRNEYAPAGSQWYYDASLERNRDELASSVWWLVYEYGKLELAGARPARIYVDNYGGAIVAPLDAPREGSR